MKKPIILLSLSTVSAIAATVWSPAPNAVASASWDTFTFSSPAPATGSQGAPQATTGGIVDTGSSVLNTTVFGNLAPPAGIYGGGDRYYIHNGGATWLPDFVLNDTVSFVRVSYSLLQAGGAYGIPPVIPGAIPIGSNFYPAPDGGGQNIFYHDFESPGPSSSISVNAFGDAPPGFSFRSFDALLVEEFIGTTVPVPEPSSSFLVLLGDAMVFHRKRA